MGLAEGVAAGNQAPRVSSSFIAMRAKGFRAHRDPEATGRARHWGLPGSHRSKPICTARGGSPARVPPLWRAFTPSSWFFVAPVDVFPPVARYRPRPPPGSRVETQSTRGPQLPVSTIRSAQERRLPYFCLNRPEQPPALSRLPLIRPAVDREAKARFAGAPTATRHPRCDRCRRCARPCGNEQTAVAAPSRRPPVLGVGHQGDARSRLTAANPASFEGLGVVERFAPSDWRPMCVS